MTAHAAVLSGPGVAEWAVWTTTARVVVTDAAMVREARSAVCNYLARVDRAASRFRPDSEVSQLARANGAPVAVSALLAELVGVALEAARRSDGRVDPTMGSQLADLGYDRDLADVSVVDWLPGRVTVRRRWSWRDVRLDGRRLAVPPGVVLDLGATAKAYAADRCATTLADRLGCGVLVSLGGDLRVSGPPPAEGWGVLVQDGPAEPASHIQLRAAQAVATSSTLHRTWQTGAVSLHHILDPLSCRPATPTWRTVSAAAETCVAANTLSTEAIVRGKDAVALLREAAVAARLVADDGTVTNLGGWPA